MSDPKKLPAADASFEEACGLDGWKSPTPKNLDALSLLDLAAYLKKLELEQLLEPELYSSVLHVK